MTAKPTIGLGVLLAVAGLAGAQTPPATGFTRTPYRATPSLVAHGARVFAQRCADCHGSQGRGDGPVARYLVPKPRDLTRGVYGFRSTPSGTLPTDWDIYRTLGRGLPGTAMPAWSGLPDRSLWGLVHYLKSLSDRFESEPPGEPIPIPAPRPQTLDSLARGRRAYQRMKCGECHGADGRGAGPAAWTLVDDLGQRVFAFDFTRGWKMKGGSSPEDVYRIFHTGVDGTPMPSYADVISEEESWDLVNYTRSLFVE